MSEDKKEVKIKFTKEQVNREKLAKDNTKNGVVFKDGRYVKV